MAFFAWLEQTGIATWVNSSDSVLAYPTVLLLHTIGLSMVVGINIVIDLRLLGFGRQIPVLPMQRFFPMMWAGLALNAVTGALLLSAKATQFVINPAFYVKMASILLAVGVFFAMKARVFGDPLLDRKPVAANAKLLAALSLTLWLLAITAGRWMAYIGEAAHFALLTLS